MTNGAAIGYMKLAAKRAKLPPKTIILLEEVMREMMDYVTEEEAEKAYNKN